MQMTPLRMHAKLIQFWPKPCDLMQRARTRNLPRQKLALLSQAHKLTRESSQSQTDRARRKSVGNLKILLKLERNNYRRQVGAFFACLFSAGCTCCAIVCITRSRLNSRFPLRPLTMLLATKSNLCKTIKCLQCLLRRASIGVA